MPSFPSASFRAKKEDISEKMAWGEKEKESVAVSSLLSEATKATDGAMLLTRRVEEASLKEGKSVKQKQAVSSKPVSFKRYRKSLLTAMQKRIFFAKYEHREGAAWAG